MGSLPEMGLLAGWEMGIVSKLWELKLIFAYYKPIPDD